MSFGTLHIGPDRNGQVDLIVTKTGDGRGTLSFDLTIASALLIALGSHRRADSDDALPSLLTEPDGTIVPLGGKRGWVGDVLQSDGQRLGSKLWLLERAKRTEGTRITAEDYAQESVDPIGAYHGQELVVSASWDSANKTQLNVTVNSTQTTVTQRVVT